MHPKGNWMLRTLTEMVYPINIEKLESKPFFLSGADFCFFDKTIMSGLPGLVKTWMGFLSEGTSFHYTTLELVKECVANSQSYFFPILADIPNLKYQCLPILIFCLKSKSSNSCYKIPIFLAVYPCTIKI